MNIEILSFLFLMFDFCSNIFTRSIHKRKIGVLIKLLSINQKKKNPNSSKLKIQIFKYSSNFYSNSQIQIICLF